MRLSHEEESWWLTRDQRRFLLAIFGEDAIAAEAWKDWRGLGPIATMDPACMAFVPLLFGRSTYRAIDTPEFRAFKGVYRRTWYHNHLVLRDLANVVVRFREAGIKALLPADLSILVTFYKDLGLRPLNGPELLVDSNQVEAAVDVLLESGWMHNLPFAVGKARLERTSIWFSDGSGKQFVLRWEPGAKPTSRAGREAIWTTAVTTSVCGEETLALSSTELLLAMREVGCWHPVPSGRWVADALTVLLCEESKLEWSRVIEISQRSRMSFWFYSRLSYLQNQWSVSIPAEVLEAINQVPKSVFDRLEYGVRRCGIPMSTDSAIYKTLGRVSRWQSSRNRFLQFLKPTLVR